MESQQCGGTGAQPVVEQCLRIEFFVKGKRQIVRKTPVNELGNRDPDKPVGYFSAVDLRNPQAPGMTMHVEFSIPGSTLFEAFNNWQIACDNAQKHVVSELRSKIVLAAPAAGGR